MSAIRYLVGVVLLVAAFAPITIGAIALRKRLLRGWTGPRCARRHCDCAGAYHRGVGGAPAAHRRDDIAPLTVAVGHRRCRGLVDDVGATHRRRCHRSTADVPSLPQCSLRSRRSPQSSQDGAHSGSTPSRTARPASTRSGTTCRSWRVSCRQARFPECTISRATASRRSSRRTALCCTASGCLAFRNDLLSPFLNMGFVALAFLAAWCIGRPFGLAPATMTGLWVVMGTPMLVGTQPGTAYNDTIGIVLVLAAVAILVTASQTSTPPTVSASCVAAAAAGIAFGTKLQFIVPVAALSVRCRDHRPTRRSVAPCHLVLAIGGGPLSRLVCAELRGGRQPRPARRREHRAAAPSEAADPRCANDARVVPLRSPPGTCICEAPSRPRSGLRGGPCSDCSWSAASPASYCSRPHPSHARDRGHRLDRRLWIPASLILARPPRVRGVPEPLCGLGVELRIRAAYRSP